MTTKNRKRSLSAFVALIGVLLMSSGFAVMASAGSANATDKHDEECVEKPGTEPSYTDWMNKGGVIKTHDSNPPGENTNTVRYVKVGEYKHVTQQYVPPTPGTEGHWKNLGWYNWTGGPRDTAPPLDDSNWHGPLPNPPQGAPHNAQPGTVYNTSQNDHGLASWFKYDGDWVKGTPGDPGKPEESHTDYKWKKQVREYVPGTDPVKCDDPEPDDVCPNIDDIQESVPEGLVKDEAGNCVPPQQPDDVCPNIDDIQPTVPEGLIKNEAGDCVEEQVEPPAVCGPETDFPGRPLDGSQGSCNEEVSPPGEEPPAAAPPVNNPPAKSPTPTKRATSAVAGPTTSTSSAVAGPTIPSTVKAGLGEDVAELAATRTSQGLALVGAGALVMLAGGLGMVRRRGVVARI